jgi:acyl dehydratase
MATISPDLPEAMVDYHRAASARIGERTRHHIGVIDERLIRRYATAIGDMNPIYHDADAARAAGYAALVAPPNLLAAVVDWGAGKPESELGPDGTSRQGSAGALRVMGAGEEMEVFRPVTAGVDVYEEVGIDKVELKQGKSGPLLFVTSVHDFIDASGAPYNRNRRTVMVRP